MRYTIRRVSLWSALRTGCVLGWVIALCPAIGIALLVGELLARANQALVRIAPFDITIYNQTIASIDVLAILRLSETAQTVHDLARNLGGTVLLLTLVLIVLGTIAVAFTVALFCLGYNLLARIGGGVQVELRNDDPLLQDASR